MQDIKFNLQAISPSSSLTKPRLRATDAAMLLTFLQVALGGALGAMMRFGVGISMLRLTGAGFPLGVLTVNIVGSFIMGAFMVFSFHRGFDHFNAFVMTGLLGGFTTFSAFSLEAFTLFERGQIIQAGLYVFLSVTVSITALVLGVWIARAMWT